MRLVQTWFVVETWEMAAPACGVGGRAPTSLGLGT